MLTGSYHNYFRIYDVDTLNDVVLQADKSAFKAKKIGGPLPGNKLGAKNGVRPGGLRENMALDTLDFNKKILHASWHPRENTIAVRLSFLADSDLRLTPLYATRLRRQITCSCIALHDIRLCMSHSHDSATLHSAFPSHPPHSQFSVSLHPHLSQYHSFFYLPTWKALWKC